MWFFHAYRSFLAFAACLMPHKKIQCPQTGHPQPGAAPRGHRSLLACAGALLPRAAGRYSFARGLASPLRRLLIKYAHGHSLFYITTAHCSCQCLQLTLVFLTDFAAPAEKFLRELYG
ncbi:hypothetical protein [Allofournierella massiliensis]|uniref:hypothetical protein n=1 Tax=Allofournierella massiliensis TaxID=1650663 RepID=UPI0025A37423|nr:hypothetical protein [Fournierella massiliensis]